VLLRFAPATAWPLLLAAVRDEFVDRSWDPPAAHWVASAPRLVGGRDRTAGGTWLAVRPDPPGVAAILNGVHVPPPAYGSRPSRGGLPLTALTDPSPLDGGDFASYDGFHLLRGTPERVEVWSWDGASARRVELSPGDHILVNAGVDTVDDPLVPHFAPLLAAVPTPDPRPGRPLEQAWGAWPQLLAGDGLAPDDPRALLVRREFAGRVYGSTSASLVAIGSTAVRFDFTGTPQHPHWQEVPLLAAG
jgi:Transport and Golgi organisation 2